MKTFSAKKTQINKEWHIIDAENQILGRLATKIAIILKGKHKPEYTPHVDTGDYVVVINAAKVRVTGKKYTDKIYYRHTGYPGGIKETTFKEMIEKFPERTIEKAVKGMLPKNSLGRSMYTKLKVYANAEHKHEAQKPTLINL